MRVIGTAGHVDHGKSTLVQALTGTHPDRLKEEQQREMTIDLGFAWMTLPNGENVGIVDVPGHRDFIENMLAGVGGIDAAIFVVAADEGIMPQSREHLSILDLLQVQGGVIALTKTDLIDDPEWLEMIQTDIQSAIRGTVLAGAPIIPVSARTGAGIDTLKEQIAKILLECPVRPDLGRPRLPIDRVFTIAGFGTVVTGTLTDGILRIGDEIEILPGGLKGRIRSLQSHKHKEITAVPGGRTAVNISGLDTQDIRRGDVLSLPGKYKPSQRLDVHFRLLPDASSSLHHNTQVKLFLWASEVSARVRLLGTDELLPGEAGWLQLDLNEPVVAVRGDHYILRRPSPGETLGGGTVVDPQPDRRHKRFDEKIIARLERWLEGAPEEVLFQAILSLGPTTVREAITRSRLTPEQSALSLQELITSGQIIHLDAGSGNLHNDSLIIAGPIWQELSMRAVHELENFHHAFSLRRGMQREELKSRLGISARLFNAAVKLWSEDGTLFDSGKFIARPDHKVSFSAGQQVVVDQLLTKFSQAPYSTPSVKECIADIGDDLFTALLESGIFIMVSPDVVFRKEDYQKMQTRVLQHFEQQSTLTAAQFRDLFNTSRKYALAFLENLDALGITLREGDIRILRPHR